jgi:hypothetical protein
MQKIPVAPFLVMLVLGAMAAPGVAQAIPDDIPDKPGESPADRAMERRKERYRGFLSHLYTAGSLDLAPVTASGFAYQATLNLGVSVGNGDAVFMALSVRDFPFRTTAEPIEPGRELERYVGVGLALGGTRLLGSSPVGERSALNLGMGVLTGEVPVMAFEVSPTYDLMRGHSWSVPAGIKLNVATFGREAGSVTRAFLGLSLGARLHFGQRERLD